MHSRFALKPVAVALLAGALISGSALAEDTIKEETTVLPDHTITSRDEARISSVAVKVLRHIADARGDLQGDSPEVDKAESELDQAEKLLEIIQPALPTTKVKGHLDAAKQAMEKGDKPKAQEQLTAADNALIYVEADLPLGSTRHLVAQAKADLDKGDAKAALWRSWQDYELGAEDYAKADLNEAVEYLERAAMSTDDVTREAAQKLVSEVRDLHQLIETGDKGFGAKIESSWNRLEALSERNAEYISTGWQRLRAEDAGKKDLIEAKLQLAYARIDHHYAKDDAAAKVDLAAARGYLDAAMEQSKSEEKEKVGKVAGLVKGLEKSIGSGKTHDKDAFHQAEAQLSALIRQM